jgi:hypothetical protein
MNFARGYPGRRMPGSGERRAVTEAAHRFVLRRIRELEV